MLDFYQNLDIIEQVGKDIVIPDSSHDAIYLSEGGKLFCYTGIHIKDRDSVFFNGWPYYLVGKHSGDCKQFINGFFRIKDGCILLSNFIDHDFYSKDKYKLLSNYAIRLPVVSMATKKSAFLATRKSSHLATNSRQLVFSNCSPLSFASAGLGGTRRLRTL